MLLKISRKPNSYWIPILGTYIVWSADRERVIYLETVAMCYIWKIPKQTTVAILINSENVLVILVLLGFGSLPTFILFNSERRYPALQKSQKSVSSSSSLELLLFGVLVYFKGFTVAEKILHKQPLRKICPY